MTETDATITNLSSSRDHWVANLNRGLDHWCNECQKRTHHVAYFPPHGGNGEYRCTDENHAARVIRNERVFRENAGKFGNCSCCGPGIQSLYNALKKLEDERE